MKTREQRRPWILIAAVLFISAVLNLTKLGEIYFWADEGITLLLGKLILRWGVPRVSDEWFESCYAWGVSKEGIWVVHGWMQYYLAALGQFFAGTSVAGNRLPFALLGIGAVFLLERLARRLRLSDSAVWIASLLGATCVPLILFNRNVRYYALLPFLTLTTLIAYVDLLAGKKRAWIYLTLSGFFLVHSSQAALAACAAAIGIHAALFHRDKRIWQELAKAAALLTALYLPYFLYAMQTMRQARDISGVAMLGSHLRLADFLLGACLHLIALLRTYFPTLLLIPLLFLHWRKKWSSSLSLSGAVLLGLVVLMNCAVLSFIFNAQLYPGYVLGAVPALFILAAAVIEGVACKKGWLLLALTLATITSSVLMWPYWPTQTATLDGRVSYIYASQEQRRVLFGERLLARRIEFPLWAYLGTELVLAYDGPVEAIVAYLRTHAQPKDTFFATNDQETLYISTGLGNKIRLPFDSPPNWIIRRGRSQLARGACPPLPGSDDEVNQYIKDLIRDHRYEMIVLDAPNFPQENGPAFPAHHRWSTEGRMWKDKVVLFHLPSP